MNVARSVRRALRQGSSVATTVAVLLVARASLADHYRVPSASMWPTIEVGDHVVVDKLAYGLRVPLTHHYVVEGAQPARGDVVVLDSPESDAVLLKRVAAVPGDRVVVREGRLEINGEEAQVTIAAGGERERLGATDHAVDFGVDGGPDYGPVTLPPRQFLVMGDNRGNSHDGRSFGLVERGAILGRVEAVLWRFGAPTVRGVAR